MKRGILLALPLVAWACGGSSSGPPTVTGPTPRTTAVLVGAGDIADCSSRGPELTARLLDSIDGTVFTAGDNAYFSGSARDFQACYEPTWGRHKDRTRPAPGNHDYEQPGARDYFAYFGPAAGPPGRGYYRFNAGEWTVFSLNSNVPINRGSPQVQWLLDELRTASRCTIAILHHPPFSSGPNGSSPFTRDLWRELYANNNEIVIAGHDHSYERFSPQDDDARVDLARGMRLFVVGSGGANLTGFPRIAPNSSIRLSQFGVLKLTLRADAYDWQFIGVDNNVGDAGSGVCH